MGLRRRSAQRSSHESVPASDRDDKLSHVRPIAHDEDERPNREDMDYGSTIFTRPVPLPAFFGAARRPRALAASPQCASSLPPGVRDSQAGGHVPRS
jgi:hypothetical protein